MYECNICITNPFLFSSFFPIDLRLSTSFGPPPDLRAENLCGSPPFRR